jgi:hypothetical protein
MRDLLAERSFWVAILTMGALLAYLAWLTYQARRPK